MATYKLTQKTDANGTTQDIKLDASCIDNLPTVNNGTLTIQKNGSTVATFGANASTNVTANITVPTTLGDLTNDMGFMPNGSYRGTFGNWSSVPTNSSSYEADDNNNTTPFKNDFIIVNDCSGKLDDSALLYLPDITGGGASFGCIYNGITQIVKYTSAMGSSNAKTLNNVVSVYYDSNIGKWMATTLRACTFNGVSYNANSLIAQWSYATYNEGYAIYDANTNGGIFIYDGVWGTNGKNGWKAIASINSMVSGVKNILLTKSTVSGTDDGTNWTSITVDGTTKNIPVGVSITSATLTLVE